MVTCLPRNDRAADAGGVEVAGEAVFDGVVAEPCPGAGREQRIAGLTAGARQAIRAARRR